MSASALDAPAPVASRPGLARHLQNPAWLLAPAACFLAFMYVLPLADLIWTSVSGPDWTFRFVRIFRVALYWNTLLRTLGISATVAFLCLIFGYPTALLLHRARGVAKTMVGLAIILPYFIAILIRTYAWMVLLARTGPVNKLAVWLGVLGEPTQLVFNRGSVLLGMTTVLLPVMVLSIYASVARLDDNLARAAQASGAGPIAYFWRIALPLTLPGIGAGCLLVFVTAIGFFITPTLLGSPRDQMFAMLIAQQAQSVTSDGFLQALAVVLLAITVGVVGIAGRILGFEFIWGGGKLSEPARDPARRSGGHAARSAAISRILADMIGWPLLRLLGSAPAQLGPWTVRGLGILVVSVMVVPILVVMLTSLQQRELSGVPTAGLLAPLV